MVADDREVAKDEKKSPSDDMDIEEKETKFSFNVLQLIKTAQGEHGVKHHDYTRYRRYCSARLRRLYKSLKFTHGRGRYVKRSITVPLVNDVRFLHIILYQAERAWGYGMAIKQAIDGPNSRRRCHLIARLAKAAKWAELFSQACTEKADSRTSLEAAAYALYMKGCYLVEREQHWESALRSFTSARVIYEELGKYGSVENQVLCRQRVDDELEPNIRFCLYKMGRSNSSELDLSSLAMQGVPGLQLLQEQLEKVMAEARSQQAVNMTELNWFGRKFSINNAKIRSCITKGQQLEKDLNDSTTSLSLEKRLSVFDKIFTAYHEARRHIREDLVMAGSTEDVRDNLNGLDKAVSCIILQKTIDRNLLLVTISKNRMTKQHTKDKKNDKTTKPQELVRLYDLLLQNLSDLSDLALSGKEKNSEEAMFAKVLDAKKLAFQATRCFYLAQFYLAAGKHAEAYVLFHRAQEYADIALKKHEASEYGDKVLLELRTLSEDCRVQSCLTHAMGVANVSKLEKSLQNGISSISLNENCLTNSKKAGYLLERIDEYESVVATAVPPSSKEPPHITPIPPSFQAVPCRPIVLDTAVNAIVFPSLEGRVKKEDKKKSFFGFWR